MAKEKENKPTRISKIVLTIDGKDITLSLQSARELQKALNDMFGDKVEKVIHEHTYPWSYPQPMWTYITSGNTLNDNEPHMEETKLGDFLGNDFTLKCFGS